MSKFAMKLINEKSKLKINNIMKKLLVFHEYYSDCYKNLDTSSFDLAEQSSLNK